MHKPSFCPDSRLSFQMMWEQQPALLPKTWSPLMPLLQRCSLLPKSGGFAPSPAFVWRLRLWPEGSTPLFLCPLSPLAFLLAMPSGGSLVFPVVRLLWLKPIQRQAGTERASNRHPGAAKLPCAGMPTGDPREKRTSMHTWIYVCGCHVPALSAMSRHCHSAFTFFPK